MARLSFLVLLAAAFANVCVAASSEQQVMIQDACVTHPKWSWCDCGSDTDKVHIKSIEISPDPPAPGKDLTVTVKGSADESIEDGAYADVMVKVGAIKLLQKEFDVCEEARNANASIQCPVKEGDHEVTHTVALPKEIPRAPFSVNIRGYTADDDDMVCLDLKIDFRTQRFW
ncbi:ML domain-containing protein [Amylocystis lapponica]|nr:ML domain-containing protein [Amylocystis lapponica]